MDFVYPFSTALVYMLFVSRVLVNNTVSPTDVMIDCGGRGRGQTYQYAIQNAKDGLRKVKAVAYWILKSFRPMKGLSIKVMEQK